MINNLKKLNVTLQTCFFYKILLKQLKYYINQFDTNTDSPSNN